MHVRASIVSAVLLFCCGIPCAEAGLHWPATQREVDASLTDAEVTVVYAFTNTGPGEVAIRDIRTTCGCTAAKPDKTLYAPGEGGEIRAVFTIGSRFGRNVKKIHVLSSDAHEPVRELVLTVNVPELMRPSRSIVYWHVGREAGVQTVDLTAQSPHDMKILGVHASTTNLVIEIEDVEPGRRAQLHIRPRTTAQAMTERVRVDVRAADAEAKRTYTIFARVLPTARPRIVPAVPAVADPR